MQFRVIDGLSLRFAQSEDRDEHALLLSPWPESQLAFELRASCCYQRREYGRPRWWIVESPIGRPMIHYVGHWPTWTWLAARTHLVAVDLPGYEGGRMVESMRYVRAYPAELPVLRDLLPQIQTPVQLIAGRHDTAVPPANAEFLHDRLPNSKLDLLNAGHFTWEDARDDYAALVTSWWNGDYTAATSTTA
jgi:pimeloyl-ACP methyl ester carboxylesterase